VAAERGVEISGRSPLFLCLLAATQHRAGHREEAERTLADVQAVARQRYVPEVFLALTTLWLHGPDSALPMLERAFAQRDSYLVIMKASPWFDPIRVHPAYRDLLRRMNLEG
jgi:hypothetical protein